MYRRSRGYLAQISTHFRLQLLHFLMILMMFLHKNKRRAPVLKNNLQLLTHHDDWLTSEHEDISAALNSWYY